MMLYRQCPIMSGLTRKFINTQNCHVCDPEIYVPSNHVLQLQNKIGDQDEFTYLGDRRILYMPTSNCYYVWTVALIWSVQPLLTMSDYWIKLFPLLLLIEEEHICMKLQNWWYLENIIFTWNVVNLYYQGANTAWSHSSLPPYIVFYIICYLLYIIV